MLPRTPLSLALNFNMPPRKKAATADGVTPPTRASTRIKTPLVQPPTAPAKAAAKPKSKRARATPDNEEDVPSSKKQKKAKDTDEDEDEPPADEPKKMVIYRKLSTIVFPNTHHIQVTVMKRGAAPVDPVSGKVGMF